MQFLTVGAMGTVVNLLALTALMALAIPTSAAIAGGHLCGDVLQLS